MKEGTIWGIHGGKTGDADNLFLKKNCVAIGWAQIGDLSKLPPDWEALKAAVAKTYPDAKPGAIPNNAGQLYRFVHEMQVGDLVVYPSKRDRQIHIGTIEGSYRYDPSLEESYPNLRPVKWLNLEKPLEGTTRPRSPGPSSRFSGPLERVEDVTPNRADGSAQSSDFAPTEIGRVVNTSRNMTVAL